MKKTLCAIGIILIFLMSGCLNKNEVTEELINYHNNDWLKLQEIKDTKISSKVSKYISYAMEDNEEAVANLLTEEILPSHLEIVDYLEGINLESKEIEKLNQLQIDAEKFGYKIFKEQAETLKKGERSEIDAMFDRFETYDKELQEKYEEVDEKRDELMEKYNVQWVEEYDENGDSVMKMERKEEVD